MITINFIIGLIVGGIGGYSLRVYLSNKMQRTQGDKSPNIIGDKNSIKM